ncbi:hypothetical protein S245_014130 [Arachis hypogaea]|nr:uncharacterized protein DS421_4g134060 [Arachis hypogaea]
MHDASLDSSHIEARETYRIVDATNRSELRLAAMMAKGEHVILRWRMTEQADCFEGEESGRPESASSARLRRGSMLHDRFRSSHETGWGRGGATWRNDEHEW